MVLIAGGDATSASSTTEVPVRASGKRASARNPYFTCKGCSEFMDVGEAMAVTTHSVGVSGGEGAPAKAFEEEVGVQQSRDQWHEECFKLYYEQE